MSLESGYTALLVVHRSDGDLRIVMETWEDGGITPSSTKHRNPVTREETARGGLRTRADLTMARECDAEAWALLPQLEDSSGRDNCTAIKQMVGARGEAIGAPYTLRGVLGDVSGPNYNLSGDEVGMLNVTVSTNENRA
jgi:hypothetical protein